MIDHIKLPEKFVDGGDANTGMPVFGILHEGVFIHDPHMSSCGRFEVDPSTYGLSKEESSLLGTLNRLLDDSAEAAINAACLTVQTRLGITSGDVAGVVFSDNGHKIAIAGAVRSYIRTEFAVAQDRRMAIEDDTVKADRPMQR